MTPEEQPLTAEEKQSALFAQMVMHVAGTAMVMLGRMPNPMTKKTEIDLDSARLLIDQLEMLEIKTKGNLTGEEQQLLKQNLMMLRMGFVQAVEAANKAPATANTDAPAKS